MNSEDLLREVAELRASVESLTHPEPKLGTGCVVGENVRIDPSCVFFSGPNASITIGDHTQVWRGAEWLGPITVGKRVFINQGSYVRPNVILEDDVSLGPFVRLISDTHDISNGARRTGTPRKDRIVIGRGSWIGAGATVMGGVTVGSRSIVAAGAVVNADVPDNVVVAGIPARIVRHIEDAEDGVTLVPIAGPVDSSSRIRIKQARRGIPQRATKLRSESERRRNAQPR